MPHIVLLGDSVFDNAAYTGAEPDVLAHLRSIVPSAWRATLLAVDGATTGGLARQSAGIPSDASHVVVSIGGNDVLGHMDLLSLPARSTADTLTVFGQRSSRFESDYRSAIKTVLTDSRPLTLCTIYNGDLRDRKEAALARVALTVFNDAILRTAFECRASVIDLRLVCSEPADYANPIEPSGRGGLKIAHAIARAAGALPGDARTRVFT